MNSQYFHNKEGSFSVIAFPGRVMKQATKDLWWSSLSTRWTANTSCTHLSFCLWLWSRRNTFHFPRNKCYDSHMDWIKSTKIRPLSQRLQIWWNKIRSTCSWKSNLSKAIRTVRSFQCCVLESFEAGMKPMSDGDISCCHLYRASLSPTHCKCYSARTRCLCSGSLYLYTIKALCRRSKLYFIDLTRWLTCELCPANRIISICWFLFWDPRG